MYLDVLWFLNFSVDLLLLVATNRLTGFPTAVVRAILAAALGGLYGSMCILPGWFFLSGTAWRLIFLGLIGCITFGLNKNAVRRCVVFIILSMALGGIAVVVGRGGFASILFCAISICAMCFFGLRGRLGRQYIEVEIRHAGKCHHFTAMIDTGHTLSDPITGQQVLVVSAKLGRRLLGQKEISFSDPVSAIEHIEGGRLIPYRTVGSGGLLAAKSYQDVMIGKWHGACVVAFSPQELGQGEAYEALAGGVQ